MAQQVLLMVRKNITFFLLIFISGINGKDEDSVTQFPSSVRSREGDVSLLHCNFTHSSAYQNVFLQWYRKEEGKIKYILQTSTLDGMNKEVTADGHFSALLDKQLKTTYLTIHAIRVTDSAFYYCALSPTTEIMLLQSDQKPSQAQYKHLFSKVSSAIKHLDYHSNMTFF
uniref:Ig-like domain-containing protein n=1 Tax=Erpetoichthys calabaricus TaxID=27687 RepID=A0A8C4X6A2_ERPCA